MAGLDENGLTIKRLPEVLADLVTSEQEIIDPNISTRDDELLGQLNTIIASALSEQWELQQSINDNFNLLKAEGKNLDDLGALTGTVRQIGTKSTTLSQLFTGDNGSLILAGVILQNPSSLDRFIVSSNINITTNSCVSAKFSVANIIDNEEYTLTVNSTIYSFTSDGTATGLEILNGIKEDIDLDGSATWTAVVDIPTEQLVITTDNDNISIVTITYLIADEVTVAGPAEAEFEGLINAPSNSVINIVTSSVGLTSTTNPDAYIIGRLRELDEDYRTRILSNQQASGKATVDAIQDTVRNVAGVTTAGVVENVQFVVDVDGRPPKSFEVTVQGGLDADIANSIWISKPAGIETFGTTSTNIIDSSGNQQTINYTRPVSVNLAFLVEYTLYDEETFPLDGESSIATSVQSLTDTLAIDEDVIPSRYFGSIYSATEGIDSIVVKVQVIANPGDPTIPGSFQTTKLPISFKQFASTTSADITVVGV